jgi:large subunit ribosomal protein L13
MLPEGNMGRQLLTNLRVYKGTEHPHAAQNPEVVDIAGQNPKNKRG